MDEISVTELAGQLNGDAPPLLLDVREQWEVDTAAIAGARHIPMDEVQEAMGALPRDRDIVVICHHGGRSFAVAMTLARAGFRAVNLAGGIDAWSREIDPSVPAY